MNEPKPSNQTLLLQIVRDIEILKANSIQKQANRNAWIPALITASITSAIVLIITKGLGF